MPRILGRTIRLPERRTGLLLAMMLLCVALSACQGMSGDYRVRATDALNADDVWLLKQTENESASALSAANVDALIESGLQRVGVANVVHSAKGAHRYTVNPVVKQWQYGGHFASQPMIELSVDILDNTTGKSVWSGELRKQGSRNSTITAITAASIDALLEELPVQFAGRSQSAAVGTTAGASHESRMTGLPGNDAVLGLRTLNAAPRMNEQQRARSLAIFYGAQPPLHLLSQFSRVVLEPDNAGDNAARELANTGSRAYAYLSIGETGPGRSYLRQLSPSWIIGTNPDWDSRVMDLGSTGWSDFLLQRIDSLVANGYQGLFLDTLDSYQIAAGTDAQRQYQQRSLVELVRRIKQRHPQLRLIANRGFEVLAELAPMLESVAAESLYSGWNNAIGNYVPVSRQDREWIMAQLSIASTQYGLDTIAIDYVSPGNREQARKIARQITAQGITPWISTPALDYMGVGSLEVLPRETLFIYDSRQHGVQEEATVHRLAAMPMEYMGYVPVYVDLATEPLPAGVLTGRYAGIISWTRELVRAPGYAEWLKSAMRSGLPVALFGSLGVELDDAFSQLLGVRQNAGFDFESAQVTVQDSLSQGFERALPRRFEQPGLNVRSVSQSNEVHLSLKDAAGVRADLVITGPWGGFAADPAAANLDIDGFHYWVSDPFAFLEKALGLENMPMPDVTTENGMRLWSAHIDGDALPSWSEMPGRELGAEVIQRDILEHYQLPHTVSVVEAEITSLAAVADRRARMINTARSIFALPYVEIATHSYSHPYNWEKVIDSPLSGRYNLPVGRYVFDANREIAGSAAYIDNNLAPAGKRTAIMLWTGDALPGEKSLQAANDAGLPNMNGGDTTTTFAHQSLSRISPMARVLGEYVQVFAPIMNENVYTNDWAGPFDGFRNVIDTFELTDKPRRIKPLSIYYHFYAGTKKASLRSLQEVYDWSAAQDILPVHASYYARLVPDFRKAVVSRYADGRWRVSELGNVRSLRILDNKQWPSMPGSQGLAGARALHDGLYIHTNGADSVSFNSTGVSPSGPYLVATNGHVAKWSNSAAGLAFRITGWVPVVLELAGASTCTVSVGGKPVPGKQTGQGTTRYSFSTRDTGNAILSCQA